MSAAAYPSRSHRRIPRWFLGLAVVVAALMAAALVFAPAVYAEVFIFLNARGVMLQPEPADPAAFRPRPGPAAGAVVDGRWRVEQIAPDTWALGEPQDHPDNYEYLLAGKSRALLIDAGSSRDHDLRPVLAGLTRLPVTVIPSHLHFDHVNGLPRFGSVALIDLPQTRARAGLDGWVQLTRHQYMGEEPPRFHVTEWVMPGQAIDLGGRVVTVLSTPGHTRTSVSVSDPAAKLLFTGDYIYPTTLYAFMPDSSLSDYVATADRLLSTLPPDTRLYTAHCCRNDAPPRAPWLTLQDLRDVRAAAQGIQAGTAKGRGLVLRRFPVNSRMTMLTLYPFGNR
ncbi:MBL fold metallo-hydrolase [Caulobacter sp. KR2-114]|uniref:MBL fold metallo-hydrolase n=1 Tax=Caulobacter sp. KR2-114 TaxID=3400912 RepID=UPI003C04F317